MTFDLEVDELLLLKGDKLLVMMDQALSREPVVEDTNRRNCHWFYWRHCPSWSSPPQPRYADVLMSSKVLGQITLLVHIPSFLGLDHNS